MYGHPNRIIESLLFNKAKQKSEPSTTGSNSLSAIRYSEFHVNSCLDSVVPRPTCHVNNQCFCYKSAADCTTCSSQCTEDSDIFYLTSSESRSHAGSSSEDGSSLEAEVDDYREKVNDSSGVFNISALHEIDDLIDILKTKTMEYREEFEKLAETFGQMLTIVGFQKAVLNDKLQYVESKISEEEFTVQIENIENEEISVEVSQKMLDMGKEEFASLRSDYLNRLIHEDIMKSNKMRIEEMKERLETMRRIDEDPEPSRSLELDLNKILDDVSTGRSFCEPTYSLINAFFVFQVSKICDQCYCSSLSDPESRLK
ncbi:hypothetical protein L3Y34_016810 [Caenorhabditis briggsae]|uniref:Uncharacterized protein n=1 Tax=Caenorhabditis briggsae TaxID=6238 RepID=A0AAE9DGL6_CAEBR|nr:hypothetical protein L3Y34_016810 [Caenorhabditis briggsae]